MQDPDSDALVRGGAGGNAFPSTILLFFYRRCCCWRWCLAVHFQGHLSCRSARIFLPSQSLCGRQRFHTQTRRWEVCPGVHVGGVTVKTLPLPPPCGKPTSKPGLRSPGRPPAAGPCALRPLPVGGENCFLRCAVLINSTRHSAPHE